MEIFASIYSIPDMIINNDLIDNLVSSGIDGFHLDVISIEKVLTDIRIIRNSTDLPIELHLYDRKSINILNFLKKLTVEYVSFDHDLVDVSYEFLENNKKSISVGLSISLDTDIDCIVDKLNLFNHIAIMTTFPMQSNIQFREKNIERIMKVKSKHPSLRTHIDGGINTENIKLMHNMSVNMCVSGSYIFSQENLQTAIGKLKKRN